MAPKKNSKSALPLAFPFKGYHEGGSYGEVPEGATTVKPLNVRPHDALERRLRGGQRTGISKYFDDQVTGGSAIVQALDSAVQAFDASTVVAGDELFTEAFDGYDDADFIDDGTALWDEWASAGLFVTQTASGSRLWKKETVDSLPVAYVATGTSSAINYLYSKHAVTLGSAYVVRVTMFPPMNDGTSADRGGFGIGVRLDKTVLDAGSSVNPTTGVFVGWLGELTSTGTTQDIQVKWAESNPDAYANGTNLGSTYEVTTANQVVAELRVNGDDFSFYIDGNLIGSFTSTAGTGDSGIVIGAASASNSSDTSPRIISVEVFAGSQPASLRTTKIIAVSNGSVYSGTPADGLSLTSSGSSAVRDSGRIGVQAAFQKVYFCDGIAANYKVLDLSSNTISDWVPTDGSLPVGSADSDIACRLISLYRGRIVMAGLQEDPQNWFMSASGDPLDWDYAPATTSATQAVAGNNSDAGLLGDIVTCLAPFQDDVMIIGGDHTLWVMRGDPAAGGQIDNISRQIGIVGPDAFTFDTTGVLYFMGQNGLYRMAPGGSTPELLSRGRMDKTFSEIDTGTHAVKLMYDREWQGVHIFISPLSEPASSSDHWFWDERTDSFWRDQYPTNIGPTAVHLFDADDPTDRAVLMGGYDGYIRCFDDAVMTDDGTAITSRVRFPAISAGMDRVRLSAIDAVLGTGSDPVSLRVYAGDTPEGAAKSTTALLKATLPAGRSKTIRQRLAANALALEIENTTSGKTWAFERVVTDAAPAGRNRGSK